MVHRGIDVFYVDIFERIWYFRAERKKLLFEATSKWENRPERSSWGTSFAKGLSLRVQAKSLAASPLSKPVLHYVRYSDCSAQ